MDLQRSSQVNVLRDSRALITLIKPELIVSVQQLAFKNARDRVPSKRVDRISTKHPTASRPPKTY
jgi:hypothetical protein